MKSDSAPQVKTTSLYDRIYEVVRQIPPGRVATYGQIASICGLGTARTVGYAMSAVNRSDIPWQRVLNAEGKISRRADGNEDSTQRRLLMGEGVVFDKRGRVNFDIAGWEGPDMDWLDQYGCFPAPRPARR